MEIIRILLLLQELKYPRISFCQEGNEIPKWFNHKSERSSIDLTFSPCQHNTSFFGFSICIIVEFQHDICVPYHLNFSCDYQLKTMHGDGISFQKSWNVAQSMTDRHFKNSDCVFILCDLKDYDDYHEATEAFFRFCLEKLDSRTLAELAILE